MANIQSVKTKIQGLIDKANTTTGGSDTDLTTAMDNLIDGYGSGGFDPTDGIERAINFFDTMGNLLYSYTRAEIKKLEALPEVPELEGFAKNGWSSTLEELKLVETYKDVAPIYTKNGSTANILVLETANDISVNLGIKLPGVDYKVAIDWGDGSAEETVTGSSSSSSYCKGVTHTYSTTGIYYINIRTISCPMEGYITVGATGYGSTYYPIVGSSFTSSALKPHRSYSIPQYSLLAVNTPLLGVSVLSEHYALKFVNASTLSIGYSNYFMFNPRLERIMGLITSSNNGTYFGYYCHSLKRLTVMSQLSLSTTGAFRHSKELEELFITRIQTAGLTSASVGVPLKAKRVIIDDRISSPINLVSGTPVETDAIYVPDAQIDVFRANTTWAEHIDKFKPMSEYPDY